MSRRILVVDDDPGMVRTLCDIFRRQGWDSDGAHSGEEALVAERGSAYHAVLMDIKMPGIDGVAAFKAMKQHTPDVRVVLMTAHADAATVSDAEAAGALRVMMKPVDLPALMSLLEI